jgi:hypothetical protein
MKSFSRKPARLAPDASAFIEGAEKRTEQPTDPVVTQELPWDARGVREDVVKTFNLRLPEPYHLKLAYIAEHTPQSMHNFCIDILTSAIDAKIEELSGKAGG